MVTVPDCPDHGELQQFVLGKLPADRAGAVGEHLAGCPRCVQTLEALPGIDPLVQAMRAARQEQTLPDLVPVLISRLKRAFMGDTLSLTGDPPGDTGATAAAPPAAFDFLEPPRQEGEIGWLGPYRVRQLLGSGGMGAVFLADDPRLKRQIALKVIKPELTARADVRRRFLREAQSVAAVEHENIVTIYEVNEHRGVPYLVLPLLRGESLEERLRGAGGPLPLDATLRIGRQIAEGLAAAHERGLVHRDIKPANIFLCSPLAPAAAAGGPAEGTGPVKILDFGLARAIEGEDGGVSQAGLIVGTPAYMAPEQASGEPIDPRADLFSLGCVLYRMATGRPAFEGPSTIAILARVVTAQPEPPERINPAVPRELARLIVRLLAKKPEDRPASAREVAAVLAQIDEKRAGRRGGRRRRLFLAALAALLAVAGLSAWLLAPSPGPAPPAPGEVTLQLDRPGARLVLLGGGKEQTIDLAGSLRLELAPGDYLLRPAAENAKRRPVPEGFVVKPGQQLTVPLRLVGEVGGHDAHSGPVWAVAASPRKGALWILSAGSNRRVGVWDAAGPGKAQFFEEHKGPVRALAFAPDGRSAASGGGGPGRIADDRSIRLWDVRTRKQIAQTPRESDHASRVTALTFSADGKRLASGAADGVAMIRQVPSAGGDRKDDGKDLTLPANEGEGVYGVAFSPDGKRLLTAGGDGKVIVWDAALGKKLDVLEGHKGAVRSVAVAPDGVLALSAGDDGTVRLWDFQTRTARTLDGHKGAVRQAVFTADGQRILSAGADGTVRLWDVATAKEVPGGRFTGHRGAVHGVACAADGRKAVSCGQDGTVRLWELPR